MRIAWISNEPAAAAVGGGGAYNRTVQRLLAAVPAVREVTEIPLSPTSSSRPHRLRQTVALFRSIFSKAPAKAMFHVPVGGIRAVADCLEEINPDLVVFSSTSLLPCRKAIGDRPFILVAHNIEQRLYADQIANITRCVPLAGLFLHHDLAKLQMMENNGVREASLVIAISREDAAFLESLGPAKPVFVLPPLFPGPPPNHDRPTPARPLRLALTAKMSWWPNRTGCDWLVREILTRLPKGIVELHLYGPGSDAVGYPEDIVKAHGFVQDLSTVWRDNHIAVCPIREGSGVNVKFAEAIFNGMPVLATHFGARGLPPLDDDPAIRLSDTATEWIDFLRSEDALNFAQRLPREETRRLFSDAPYLAPLAEALEY